MSQTDTILLVSSASDYQQVFHEWHGCFNKRSAARVKNQAALFLYFLILKQSNHTIFHMIPVCLVPCVGKNTCFIWPT